MPAPKTKATKIAIRFMLLPLQWNRERSCRSVIQILHHNANGTGVSRCFNGLTCVDALFQERGELIVRNGDLEGLCYNLPRPFDMERDIDSARIRRVFMRQPEVANVCVHFYLP